MCKQKKFRARHQQLNDSVLAHGTWRSKCASKTIKSNDQLPFQDENRVEQGRIQDRGQRGASGVLTPVGAQSPKICSKQGVFQKIA